MRWRSSGQTRGDLLGVEKAVAVDETRPGLAVRPRSVAVAWQDFTVVEPFEARQ